MDLTPLTAISPIDGRYHAKTAPLQDIFSEAALIRHRVIVEIAWLKTLAEEPSLTEIAKFSKDAHKFINELIDNFNIDSANNVKEIESKTNHDVKSVEYYLKEKFQAHPELAQISHFIHFGCTSEDINNIAYALMIKNAKENILLPTLDLIISNLRDMAHKQADVSMLSRTHGQPATPTTLGKEIANFVYRLDKYQKQLKNISVDGKINGAVGNFNAHMTAYPTVDWESCSSKLIKNLGLTENLYTTQIEPHDNLADIFYIVSHINTILIDCSRDIWAYISLGYFTQKINSEEVGSSTMPHKVNPIDFENAEGNLGIANAMLTHMSLKLPISRMQRDLTDSTVLRNVGAAFSYSLIAYKSIIKGLEKLSVNKVKITEDLENNYEILSEAIQTVMKKNGVFDAYEQLKKLTRGKKLDKDTLHEFVSELKIPDQEKKILTMLTPENYTGLAVKLAKKI
jgi:adenylosuccinate lyase